MKTFLSPLTPEQENECLKKLKKGSLEARNELTLHNMRLVAHVAKKYQNSEEDMEDLISIGTIGLMKAIVTYKEDYGSRLATYAARCMCQRAPDHSGEGCNGNPCQRSRREGVKCRS